MSGPELKPLLVSGPRARRLLDIGNTKYWDLVKTGAIETSVVGNRRMVVFASLEKLAQGGGPSRAGA